MLGLSVRIGREIFDNLFDPCTMLRISLCIFAALRESDRISEIAYLENLLVHPEPAVCVATERDNHNSGVPGRDTFRTFLAKRRWEPRMH